MKLIERGERVDLVLAARRRGVVRGASLAWEDKGHQDPSNHPFNNYSEDDLQRDRDVHGNLDWLRDQVNRQREERERDTNNWDNDNSW